MTFRTIGLVGFGVIGRRWAAAFAHAGCDVRVWDADKSKEQAFDQELPTLMTELDQLRGKPSYPGSVHFFPSLSQALASVDFVQENGPEDLAIKREIFAQIEPHIGEDVIIASSSSALLVTSMQSQCQNPQRILLGHPFNPAHLMPLVEIVGGEKTDPANIVKARAFYEAIGKKPVVLNREITGHLALRLMGAMWREAIALVEANIASLEDVDRAFIYGPGPKWTLQGSFISNQLNASGMEDFLHKYGSTYQAIWDSLLPAKLDEETIATVSKATAQAVGEQSQELLKQQREDGLVKILKTIAEHGAL